MASQPAQLPEWIGPYEIHSLLGVGGMGVVYRGVSPAGQLVAVKQIRGVILTEEDRERFRVEIEALKIVYGAQVVPFIDGDSAPPVGDPWLTVKYIPGATLREHLDTHGPLEPIVVAILGAALAEGLSSIHSAGLLHRDLKPHNIILGHDGPFVIDFGLALLAETKVRRAEDPGRLTPPGQVVGTLVCMPPEQVRGEDLDAAADVYALGATLLCAATGHYPYEASNQFALSVQINSPSVEPNVAGLPDVLRPAITAMLSKNREARPNLVEITKMLVGVVNEAGFTATEARALLRRATALHTPREAEPAVVGQHSQTSGGSRPVQGGPPRNIAPSGGALRAARKLRAAYARDSGLANR